MFFDAEGVGENRRAAAIGEAAQDTIINDVVYLLNSSALLMLSNIKLMELPLVSKETESLPGL